MKITGNTILITGGGSGIGRGLAEALQAEGNQVIIAGRRQQALDETTAANPGLKSIRCDVDQADGIRSFAARVTEEYPTLNVLINNAGIMRPETLLNQPDDLADMEATITTNLLGPIRLTAALLPHLQKQAASTIINVSSGLAFVPLAFTPTYSATKAAIHSYTQALRAQLRTSSIQVIELVPPAVATDLMPGAPTTNYMPLADYISESINLLKNQPDADEIWVERVKFLRLAEREERFDKVFTMLNQLGH